MNLSASHPAWPPSHHHHFCRLPLRGYTLHLRQSGWTLRNAFYAMKAIAGREAVLLVDPGFEAEGHDASIRCKVMWLSTVQALSTAYERYCEAVRRRSRLRMLAEARRDQADLGLLGDELGLFLYELPQEPLDAQG